MPNPMIAVAGIGAGAQMAAASSAANAQERAAEKQLQASRETRDIIRSDLAPYREGGQRAYNALAYELGLGDQPEGYQGISMSPAARFALEQGRGTVEAGASYRGGLYSGSAMKALEEYRMGLAQADREAQLDRITGLASSGQNAAAQTAAAETNNLNATTAALGNIGNAQAAGAIGMGNALAGGLTQGIGLYQYQDALNRGMNPYQANPLGGFNQSNFGFGGRF